MPFLQINAPPRDSETAVRPPLLAGRCLLSRVLVALREAGAEFPYGDGNMLLHPLYFKLLDAVAVAFGAHENGH